MFTTKVLYSGAALYATTTAFCAAWVCYALPAQHNKVGPFNYHRVGKASRRGIERVPWRRLPKALGASGMGLAVAKALASRGGWTLHLLDLRPPLEDVAGATFHQTNVLDYDSLSSTFQRAFTTDGRLDFVFANAGIVERFDFYATHPPDHPPPPPDLTVVDVNLKAVLHTSWLAQHYFRRSPHSANKNLVMTSSVGGLYRCQVSPSYCASKHGVLGLMRSIAPFYYRDPAIHARVNAICPGTVKTNLLDAAAWATFDDDVFVPIEKITDTVLMLIDGHDVDGTGADGKPLGASTNGVNGNGGGGGKLWGQAVELSGRRHYYREQPAYCDEHMAKCMLATERTTYNE
ncbi:hypothetical protein LTR53_009324 [Teratosphaeriaceae sp. CCFEE 6253]|nr:hypothetical protein LTR53_009324 [Teratosphaeriaceae sp. CCFEE 6253]